MLKISSLRSKFLSILFLSAIIPLAFSVFYTSLKFSDHILKNSEETSEKLRSEAQNHLLRNTETEAEELNNYFAEVKRDLESFIFTVNIKQDNPKLANEYKGEPFAFWAMSQWPEYLDKEKLNDFLNKGGVNEKYERMKSYLGEEEQVKLLSALKIMLEGFTVMSEENNGANERFYPRFLISKEIFYDLKSVTDKGIENNEPFLFLDFMSDFLSDEGKTFLNKGLQMMMPGRAMIDNHDTYRDLRLGYWGDTEKGFEIIYTNRKAPIHPAIGSVGNVYYCKSKFALLDNGLEPVWQHSGVLEKKDVSVLTYPIFKSFKDKDSGFIGFAEYWIDWNVFSDKLSKYNYYENEHNYLVSEDDMIVSDSGNESAGANIYEVVGNMKSLKAEIDRNKNGFSRFNNLGKNYDVFYSFVPEADLKLFSIVPEENFTVIADEEKKHAIEHVNGIITDNFILAGLMMIFISGISFYFSTSITNPLKNLSEAIEQISKGDLNVDMEIKSNDEIGELAGSFNKMADELRITRDQINKYSKNLENEVKSRTKELEESKKKLEAKLYESEIYSKTATDRELKMISLKQEIKDLKNKKSIKNA